MKDLKKFLKERMIYKEFKKGLKRSKRKVRVNTLKNTIETQQEMIVERDKEIAGLREKLKKERKKVRELKKELSQKCLDVVNAE